MKITKKTDLWQLTDFPLLFPVNSFLVAENNQLTLIDAGIKHSTKGILAAISKIGLPLKAIIITHAHTDHVGDLAQIKAAYPDAEVILGAYEWELLIQQEQNKKPNNLPDLTPLGIKPDRLVKEGDKINSLLVIETPGHTLGSISLFDQRHHYLIVGDLLQTRGGAAIAGDIRPLFPFPGKATWDSVKAVSSVEKILLLNPSLIACGHGNWLTNPEQALPSLIKRGAEKLTLA